ncbi:MAG: 60S ribosomal protein L37a [Candidatus Micrarchaeota archaeon]|nr:60S ribosomal protein L37a [Candidatus Micrarchaeota archaeon]
MVRFHVRGGPKLRKAYVKIKKAKTSRYACPACSKQSVKRESVGMWRCRSCGSEFAGGAYELSTPTGRLSQRLISDLREGMLGKEALRMIEAEIEKAEAEAGTAGASAGQKE